MFGRFRTPLLPLFATLILSLPASAWAAETISGAGLTVTVDPSGSYDIVLANPAWDFGGQIGYPLSNLTVASGADAVGSFSQIAFDFQSDVAHHGAIRSYWDHQAVLFTLSNSAAGSNAISFPNLTRYPQGLSHINFCGVFGMPSFYGFAPESPWVFFDGTANAFVLSPATHFMVASTAYGPNGALASGISPQIATLPAGFTHQVLLVVENGINQAFDTWGNTLTSLLGKTRPANDADTVLSQLGYWTDAGSTYYYSTLPSTSYTDTLMAVQANFNSLGIPLGYLQLDSWFYPKGPSAEWQDTSDGIYEYMGAPALFPNGLTGFQQTLGAPLATHARWIDASSPYRQQYQVSGDVSIDPLYWNGVARNLAAAGVAVYEQDWLSDKAQTNFDLSDGDAFLDGMAAAMAREHIDIQYCMPTARHFLQSAKYSNVTSIRASQDRFAQARWTNFLYAGRLASALGVWPFSDILMSGETANLLVATLSAGPVGIGDPVGSIDGASLSRAVRADGTIIKPDATLTPLDVNYLGDAHSVNAPLVAATYSDFGGLRAYYLFAYNRASDAAAKISLRDAGVKWPVYLYNYFEGTGQVETPRDSVSANFQNGWVYLVAVPIGPSGMAILGDTGHFVTLGKKRVTALEDDGTVSLTVAFAAGEKSRTLCGYSPNAPEASAQSGAIGPLTYDSATRLFSLPVMPGAGGTATIRISRPRASSPVRQARTPAEPAM
jgi:hypothetical protein